MTDCSCPAAGERFEQLMLRFTAHVLRVVCMREAKGEGIYAVMHSAMVCEERWSANRQLYNIRVECHMFKSILLAFDTL